jgi:ankyrin repeat protein
MLGNVVVAQTNGPFDIARKGDLFDIEKLYAADASIVNAVDANGSSMLILSCYKSNNVVATFLVNKNADVNYVSKNGTALMACVVKNNLTLFDLLISKGANPNLTDGNGMTALMLAVQFNNENMVKKLLDEKSDKFVKCKLNKTAFEYAIEFDNEKIINLLK